MAANTAEPDMKDPGDPLEALAIEDIYMGRQYFVSCVPFLSSRDDFLNGCGRDEWQGVLDLLSLAAQGAHHGGCAEALRGFFAAWFSVNLKGG